MRFSSSIAAFVALAGFSSANPNGWSKTKEAPDSPKKLDDCGCWPIYQAMLRCQKLKGPNANTDDCVCIENPDGWYPSMDGCRNCLTSDSDEEFFENMSLLVTQLFVSCTNAGGAVTSDGNSICASNYYREACVSLGTNGRPSWASFEVFDSDTKSNSSYVLDISEYGADESTSASTKSTAVKTTTATTAANSASTDETSASAVTTTASTGDASSTGGATSGDASGSQTAAASASTVPSSAIKLAGTKTVAGIISGMIMAVAVGSLF
ncbi:uncharacterized protein FTOL_01939 [Fusarium torulosum]|uniref:Extracellular membrane protein CFEM domain-containing protein n=1 Tax=Fusarium torulosum TaxID=33205 RepID=A0AAE8SE87_9HYPO|nr:uncharacterized protein FTOL_01939 [Fusarium torulosum]